ncbi:hypothetical protein E2C01_066158 [Portunus trituberculatus]|uniref:Uncharacterized protein n=1 Tax=Portunus trituberculatus TaxID=210409 RepID=A0A5B7HT39_PORTR|nr:hypothetical protein [Portunus trituberculatus]
MWDLVAEVVVAAMEVAAIWDSKPLNASRGLAAAPRPPGGAGGGGASVPELAPEEGREAGLPSPEVCWWSMNSSKVAYMCQICRVKSSPCRDSSA